MISLSKCLKYLVIGGKNLLFGRLDSLKNQLIYRVYNHLNFQN